MNEVRINKNVLDYSKCKRELYFYENARTGFKQFLSELKKQTPYTIFLPGYIGYSPNEGSGIFDPIEELNLNTLFYKINENICIDIEDLTEKVKITNGKKVLLLVHYFGYVDPKIEEILEMARNQNMIIIEDCAHAFFTDFVDNKCGSYGDISIYSLHKMFPFEDGGMIKVNTDLHLTLRSTSSYNLFEYDISDIAAIRKKNAKIISDQLKDIKEITLLRTEENQTPQTFPILISEKIKEKIYFDMCNAGYQLVALYFRMIPQIDKNEYLISHQISKQILNLPVHQDVEEKELIFMCQMLKKLIEKYKYEL